MMRGYSKLRSVAVLHPSSPIMCVTLHQSPRAAYSCVAQVPFHMTKTITVRYFALFREQAGMGEERLETAATTARDVFEATRGRHRCPEPLGHCKVAINDEMADWDSPVADGDVVLLFPPVAGG